MIRFMYILLSIPICYTEEIDFNLVEKWSRTLGDELFELSNYVSRKKQAQDSFKQAQVVNRVGPKIAEEISKDIKDMLDIRINAVKKIVATSEATIYVENELKFYENYTFINTRPRNKNKMQREQDEVDKTIDMAEKKKEAQIEKKRRKDDPKYAAKIELEILKKKMEPPEHKSCFSSYLEEMTVGRNASVHVPIDVYDQEGNLSMAIHWSIGIDNAFTDNLDANPSLAWQYFCNAQGFMRQYPASSWIAGERSPDIFDCRMRNWYTGTVTSPKDIIILMEKSGSMTGTRLLTATLVVRTLLDTLGPNDFVSVLIFSNDVKSLVPCFNESLVQATPMNINQLKKATAYISTSGHTNFTLGLSTAFEMLLKYRIQKAGASCNQAIMLITDGLSYDLQEVFEKYNWKEKPFYPVRMFTYLIGTQIPDFDVDEVKAIACDNQGYFVHIDVDSEVKEQVLKYMTIMSLPLALAQPKKHPISWTPVYADVYDQLMGDFDWDCKQRNKQKQIFKTYFTHFPTLYLPLLYDPNQPIEPAKNKFVLMTTISMPAYNLTVNATSLLGVAATDVPIREFEKLLQPFKLGAGGYAFIVDNNGNIVTHPDFRPIYQDDLLKPSFNSIDMVEIELLDDDRAIRDFNPLLLEIREAIVNQTTGGKWMFAKHHFDDMRRATRLKRHYYWTKIKDTPFTIVVTYPESFGQFRMQYREEEMNKFFTKGSNIIKLFRDNKYRIHPKWIYCEKPRTEFDESLKMGIPEKQMHNETDEVEEIDLPSREEDFEEFIIKLEKTGWKNWNSQRSHKCDKTLVQSLILDAKATEWFNQGFQAKHSIRKYGVQVVFIATHSGLLRWKSENEEFAGEEFADENNLAIDEIWYRRSVKQHFIDPEAFVYAVPFDDVKLNESLVTVSHAIFHKDGTKFAPAAVVGFQFQYSDLFKMFYNNVPWNSVYKTYALDNNAYIIVGNDSSDAGKFFGTVEPGIMQILINEKIFKKITIFDYQAICYPVRYPYFIPKYQMVNIGKALITPFQIIWGNIQVWLMSIVSLLIGYSERAEAYHIRHLNYPDEYFPSVPEFDFDSDLGDDEFGNSIKLHNQTRLLRRVIEKTKPEKCDKIATIYQLNVEEETIFKMPSDGCDRPFVVVPIPKSNLILLAIKTNCKINNEFKFDKNPITFNYSLVKPHDPNYTLTCHKMLVNLHRKRPVSCLKKHINESSIQDICGSSNQLYFSFTFILIAFLIAHFH